MKSKILKIIGFIIAIAAFALVCYNLVISWNQFRYTIAINWYLFATSFIILIINYSIGFYGWKFLLSKLGIKIDYWKTYAIIAVTQIGKYIPGKVWYGLGRIYLTRRLGLPTETITVSLFIETAILFLSGLLIVAISFLFSNQNFNFISLIPIAIIAVILIQPVVINIFLRIISKIIKAELQEISLSFFDLLQVLLLYAVMWLVQSFGFYILTLSIFSKPTVNPAAVIGSYIAAWLIGFASLITPSGLGVREGILSLLLRNVFPQSITYGIAIIARFWTTIAELILFLVFLPVVRNYLNTDKHSVH